MDEELNAELDEALDEELNEELALLLLIDVDGLDKVLVDD